MSAAYPRGPADGHIEPKDESDLNTLALLTKIYGWFCGFGAVVMVGFLAFIAFLVPATAASPNGSARVQGIGPLGFMIFAAVVGGGMSCAMAWLYLKSADCIKKRQSKTLIYVAAALACTNAPLGLALGIYTFVLLERPSIKLLFAY